MQCPTCGSASPPGAKFCGQCGAGLERSCSACGTRNAASFRYCGGCGARLAPREPEAAPAPAPGAVAAWVLPPCPPDDPAPHVSERRQITVMFCDLVGSTALSSVLDPEEFHELLQSYQHACTESIEQMGGYIAQYLGDGILAYFGYPIGFDDEAERAVRAGLDIVARIRTLNDSRRARAEADLGVRIGVHSGVVVINEVGGGRRREQLALGEVPNIAARLQNLAAPNSMVLSATTYRMVERRFAADDLGLQTIRGLERQERVYRVVEERRDARARVEAWDRPPHSLVGREREMERMLRRWSRARSGSGQVVVLSGDAGIGKSRLVYGFVERVQAEGPMCLEGRCLPYYQNTAFHPVVDLLWRLTGSRADQSPHERLSRLVEILEREGLASADIVRPLSSLLSPRAEEQARWSAPGARRHPERIRTALLHLLERAAAQRPVVLVLEDVHWVDASTLEFLDHLVERLPTMRILVVLTHRPEGGLPWGSLPHLSRFLLTRLERPEVEAIVDRITDGRPLPDAVRNQIIEKTDGVPLFVEELTRMVLESGLLLEQDGRFELAGPLPPLAIPSTLHDSLEARLDRLATTKELAQLGAAIGREFTYPLIQAVSNLEEGVLRRSLAQLVDTGLIQQQGRPPGAVYVFKHALIQEAAYQSLLKNLRQQYHQRIARVLESRFPELARAEPERLAQHYTSAGLVEQALPHWLAAGTRAVERSANREAIAHLAQARGLLAALPDHPGRDRRELELLLALGPALIATRGYGAREVEETYLRAAAICERQSEPGMHLQVLCGLFSTYLVQMDLERACRYAGRLLDFAERSGESGHLLAAQTAMGVVLVERGEMQEARRRLTEGLRFYDRAEHFPLAYLVGQDFGVVARAYDAFALWALGYPDQASARSREALDQARALNHPYSIAFALAFEAATHCFRREPDQVAELAAELLELCEREGFRHWWHQAVTLGGWARVELGDAEAGLAMLRLSQAAISSEDGLQPPFLLRVTVLALDTAGLAGEALELLERSATQLRGDQSPWVTAELQRLRGMLLARFPERATEAETLLRQAMEFSARQQTRSLELRTAVNLVRLLRGREGEEEARRRLRALHDSFTEGRELLDLREARELLEETAARVPAPTAG